MLINQGREVDIKVDENGVMIFWNKVCVSGLLELKKRILEEGHMSRLSIHPEATKMYPNIKNTFWWPGMKKYVTKFVNSCLTCQNSKIEHQNRLD